jgi:NadR type nicotinamide-nucleotide adenylyltransferase
LAPLARICLTGPESTGKTELAKRLSRELGVPWVPEFAREYAEARGNDLTANDCDPIARGQIALMERRPPRPPDRQRPGAVPEVILDTDLISTVVYARHYYGACPEWIEEEARRRRADLYLLLDTDVAWQPDPARETGGDAREDLFDAFRAALDEFETRWEIVSGDWEARWEHFRFAI